VTFPSSFTRIWLISHLQLPRTFVRDNVTVRWSVDLGHSVGIEIKTSTDRIEWKFEGTVWATNQDTWTDAYTLTSNGNLWAPDCHIVDGVFYVRRGPPNAV
jgi:hypothetical protein